MRRAEPPPKRWICLLCGAEGCDHREDRYPVDKLSEPQKRDEYYEVVAPPRRCECGHHEELHAGRCLALLCRCGAYRCAVCLARPCSCRPQAKRLSKKREKIMRDMGSGRSRLDRLRDQVNAEGDVVAADVHEEEEDV